MTPRLGLHVTNRCQRDCDHCDRDPSQTPVDLSLEVVAAALAFGRAEFGTTRVSLTGGEPTLHPQFVALIDLIADAGMQWDMVTNGERFASVLARLDERPSRVTALRSLSLSLDGASEATHDGIRGPGSFRAVMAAASICSVRGIPFGIQMTVHRRNVHELERLGLDAALLGAKHVSFAMMQATGTPLDEGLAIDPDEWRRIHHRIERLASVLRIDVVAPEGHWRSSVEPLCDPLRGETIHVNVHGRLSLCCAQSDVPTSHVTADRTVLGVLTSAAGLREAAELSALYATVGAALREHWDSAERGRWSGFSCNTCLALSGKPHWTDGGVGGTQAERERWRGAWAPAKKRPHLRVLP
jgi:molybdenum cofactor biosynthesis enzyme MoaA